MEKRGGLHHKHAGMPIDVVYMKQNPYNIWQYNAILLQKMQIKGHSMLFQVWEAASAPSPAPARPETQTKQRTR